MRGWYETEKKKVLNTITAAPISEADLWRKVSVASSVARRDILKQLLDDRKIHYDKSTKKWELPTWYGQR